MSTLITPELVTLDTNLGDSPSSVIHRLTQLVSDAGRAGELESLYADAMAREAKTATGVPGGIAIPHCRSSAVLEPTLAMARLAPAVDFGAKDGPADLIFFIAAPDGADQAHLKLLSKLARSLIKKDFTTSLRAAVTAPDIVDLVQQALSDEPATSDAPARTGAASALVHPGDAQTKSAAGAAGSRASTPAGAAVAVADGPETMRASGNGSAPYSTAPGEPMAGARARTLVAVTACPTGIAHTYMAADALAAAGQAAGVTVHVETQGSSGAKPLAPDVIAAADAVIFAVDVDVRDKSRFAGKPVITAPVKRGIDEPDEMIAEALAAIDDPRARRVSGDGQHAEATSSTAGENAGQKLKKWLLTGVSYMIPFVAAGGLLMALGFLLGGYEIANHANDIATGNNLAHLPTGGLTEYLGAVLYVLGHTSMGFLVAALAGYIAYGIADRPGIAPGFTVGAIAVLMNAGFIGGLIGGLLAGGVAYWIGRFEVPRWLRGLMPVVIIPLFATLVSAGLMVIILGGPIASLMNWLTGWLNSMTGASAVALGLILGLMMAFDLGGPLNKVAYTFAVAGLGAGSLANQAPWEIMAAVMAAGMVPPLAMALATVLDKKRFSAAEHENGKAAWLLGAAFITEGSIPFAAADPLRVIPSCMVGSGVTGAMIMGMGITSQAPHGGIFVFFAMNNFVLFSLAIAVGMVITALLVIALKRWVGRKPAVAAVERSTAGAAIAA